MKHLKQKHGVDLNIKIETDLSGLPDGLYQMSSPDSSASPSGSDSSSVDTAPWEALDFQASVGALAPEPGIYQDGSVLFANSAWASAPSNTCSIGQWCYTHPSPFVRLMLLQINSRPKPIHSFLTTRKLTCHRRLTPQHFSATFSPTAISRHTNTPGGPRPQPRPPPPRYAHLSVPLRPQTPRKYLPRT